jgi:ankyrin repeat protein
MRKTQNQSAPEGSFNDLGIARGDHEPFVVRALARLWGVGRVPRSDGSLKAGLQTVRLTARVRLLGLAAICLTPVFAGGAEDLKASLQRGLFEEEANHNLPAAIAAYQAVLSQFDKDRELAATAIFRLGECYRKQEKTNDAVACYQRIVREFPDAATLTRLSQQNLLALAPASASTSRPKAADARQVSLIQESIKLAEQQLAEAHKRVEVGTLPAAGRIPYEREVLRLKRELAAAQGADGAEQKKLLLQEISLVEKLVELTQKQVEAGIAPSEEGLSSRRDLLGLKRELAVLEAAPSEGAALTDEEEKEIRRIQALIQNSPDLINAPGTNGLTPLHQAAAAGYLSVARFLLANKADVNAPTTGTGQRRANAKAATALMIAAHAGNKAMVELLLDHGADVNAVGEWQRMTGAALHFAAKSGYQAVAETLLAHKADANLCPNGEYGPLHLAAEAGRTPMVELLIKHGADVNARTDWGWTPLHSAAEGGSPAVAELLLGHKADLEAKTKGGSTPLAVAVANGQIKVAEVLLKHGANVETVDGDGTTPLQKAITRANYAGYGGQSELVRLLVNGGADVNKPFNATGPARSVRRQNSSDQWDTTGATPVGVAAYLGDAAVVEALVAGGANVNTKAAGGVAPLLYAVEHKSLPMLEAILARKPDLEARDRNGNTALAQAIQAGEKKLAEKLIQAEADVNARVQGNVDFSMLHLAVWKGRPDVVELLLTNKAQVNVVNNRGQTPLDLAKEMGRDPRQGNGFAFEEIAGLLVKYGADEDFTRRARVAVARKDTDLRAAVFTKGTNDWNRYTLLELIATVFANPNDWWSRKLSFPDLSRVTIRRLGAGKAKGPAAPESADRNLILDLATFLNSGEGGPGAWLEWGDIVEVPERDHPVNETWNGLDQPMREALTKALKREVEIIIKGQSQKVTLQPSLQGPARFGGPGPGRVPLPRLPGASGSPPSLPEPRLIDLSVFRLTEVLQQSGLLRVSSDLGRIRVTRTEPATKKVVEWIVDRSPGPAVDSQIDLWLRDGDVIEVPDKGADFAPRKETPAPGAAPAN